MRVENFSLGAGVVEGELLPRVGKLGDEALRRPHEPTGNINFGGKHNTTKQNKAKPNKRENQWKNECPAVFSMGFIFLLTHTYIMYSFLHDNLEQISNKNKQGVQINTGHHVRKYSSHSSWGYLIWPSKTIWRSHCVCIQNCTELIAYRRCGTGWDGATGMIWYVNGCRPFCFRTTVVHTPADLFDLALALLYVLDVPFPVGSREGHGALIPERLGVPFHLHHAIKIQHTNTNTNAQHTPSTQHTRHTRHTGCTFRVHNDLLISCITYMSEVERSQRNPRRYLLFWFPCLRK